MLACSGDMLLQALVACAGVTVRSVATALEIPVTGTVRAEGDLDFRGTLGVDSNGEAPVGFREIRMTFDLEADADDDHFDDEKILEIIGVVVNMKSGPGSSSPRGRSRGCGELRAA